MTTIVHDAQSVINSLTTAQIVALEGVGLTAVHGLLKRYKGLSDVVNRIVSFILPGIGAVLTTLMNNSSVLVQFAGLFAATQIAYRVWQVLTTGATWLKLGKDASNAPASVATTELEAAPIPDANF